MEACAGTAGRRRAATSEAAVCPARPSRRTPVGGARPTASGAGGRTPGPVTTGGAGRGACAASEGHRAAESRRAATGREVAPTEGAEGRRAGGDRP